MATITFRFASGRRRVTRTADFFDRGRKELPVVVLVHGMGGEKRDWTDPGYLKVNYAYDGVGPSLRTHGWHTLPPAGLPDVPPQLDRLRNVTGIEPALRQFGFRTVVYSQMNTRGPIAESALELEALMAALLAHPSGPADDQSIALVGHSRGGLVIRKFLKDNFGSPLTDRIRRVVTLSSPHQGSMLANLSIAVGVSVRALVAGLAAVPALGGLLGTAIAPIVDGLTSDSRRDLAVGSEFLKRLANGEGALPGARYFTLGGTSTTLTRVWQYLYTPDSWVLRRVNTRPFFHRSEPSQWPIVSPFAETVPAPCDEIRHGRGDLLVAEVNARLPFAIHRVHHLNHAEFLWDAQVKFDLRNMLV